MGGREGDSSEDQAGRGVVRAKEEAVFGGGAQHMHVSFFGRWHAGNLRLKRLPASKSDWRQGVFQCLPGFLLDSKGSA